MSVLELATGVFIALTARDFINTGSSLLVSWLNSRRYRELLAETAARLEEYEFDEPKVKAKKSKVKA
jgi:hypothetical protein